MLHWKNVQATIDFADGLKPMYNTTHAGNVIMENQAGDHFLMYSSSKVPFGATIIPTGSGTLKGLGGVYVGTSTNYQVQPQAESDFSGLTGTRFGAAGSLTYGTPFFKGSLSLGNAITNAYVAIPYTYASGQTINASVSISGAGATGISPVSTQSFQLGTGADTLFIPITGTPSSEGTVTFTIGEVTLPSNTCSTTVVNLNVEQFYATGDTIVSQTMGVGTATGLTGTSYTYSSGLKFQGVGGAANLTFNASYLAYATWNTTTLDNTYWLITVPATKSVKDTLYVYATIQSSGTGPKNWTVKYSKDQSSWSPIVNVDPVYSSGNATPTSVMFKIYIPEANKITSGGNMYLKIYPSDTKSARSGTGTYSADEAFASGGTNRFTSKFSIVKK
jgi:hypothetical protein